MADIQAGTLTNIQAELSREVLRIVACPYPASLQPLADIVARTEPLDVCASIYHQPPCAIIKLASIVSAALPLWHHTIDILRSLSHSAEFRDQLLLQNPGLLDTLLAKANSSYQACDHQVFKEYAELCVTLLSRPLPNDVPLPAAAQSFFLLVFEQARRRPDVETLKPIYCMLGGACRGLVRLLPCESRQGLDRDIKQILCSSTTGQNSMLMLWCFGIAILVEHPEAIHDIHGIREIIPSATLTWTTESGQKLFGTANSHNKTLSLACLNVIWAAKGNVGVSDTEATEGIRIATRTLQFVDKQVRETWPTSSDFAKQLFPKLSSKILQKDISPTVQLEALSFYALMVGKNNLPLDIVAEYASALPKVMQVADTGCLKETLSASLPLFAPHMRRPSLCALISDILRTAMQPSSTHRVVNMKVLVDELAAMVPHHLQFRSHLLMALSSNELKDVIQKFLRADLVCDNSSTSQSCHIYDAMIQRTFISATTSMLLTVAITSDSVTPALSSSIGVALIRKQQQLPFIADHCTHPISRPTSPPVSLFQQECTPLSGAHLQDWRDRLKAELENQSFYQRDSVIRSVAQICHDLEVRCETVEEPLRQEREKSKALEAELSELRQTLASLETKRWEDEEHIIGLGSENERLEKEKDQLYVQLEQLKADFENANARAEVTLRETREAYNTKEMQLNSIVLAHEVDIRTREKDIEELHESIATIAGKLGTEEEETKALGDKYNSLHARLNIQEHDLENERQTVLRQADEISRLSKNSSDLEDQLQNTESELASANGRFDDLQTRHNKLVQSSEEALQGAEEQHQNDIRTLEIKAVEEYRRLNSELQDALLNGKAATEANDNIQRDLQQLQITVPPLRSKIQELVEECSKKDRELTELRDLKNRMLASMGLQPELVRPTSHSHYESSEPSEHRTSHKHRRRKSALPSNEASRNPPAVITGTIMENVANVSFASSDSQPSPSGSTPKRIKSGQSSKAPTTQTSHSNKLHNSVSKSLSKKSSPTKRSALQPASPNRRHTTASLTIPDDENGKVLSQNLPLRKRHGSMQETEQLDFDVDDFLAGTPFTPGKFMLSTGMILEREESTTEL